MGHQKVSVAHISYFWIAKTHKARLFLVTTITTIPTLPRAVSCNVTETELYTSHCMECWFFAPHWILYCVPFCDWCWSAASDLICNVRGAIERAFKTSRGSHIALVQCQWRWMTAQKQSRLPLFGRYTKTKMASCRRRHAPQVKWVFCLWFVIALYTCTVYSVHLEHWSWYTFAREFFLSPINTNKYVHVSRLHWCGLFGGRQIGCL